MTTRVCGVPGAPQLIFLQAFFPMEKIARKIASNPARKIAGKIASGDPAGKLAGKIAMDDPLLSVMLAGAASWPKQLGAVPPPTWGYTPRPEPLWLWRWDLHTLGLVAPG